MSGCVCSMRRRISCASMWKFILSELGSLIEGREDNGREKSMKRNAKKKNLFNKFTLLYCVVMLTNEELTLDSCYRKLRKDSVGGNFLGIHHRCDAILHRDTDKISTVWKNNCSVASIFVISFQHLARFEHYVFLLIQYSNVRS